MQSLSPTAERLIDAFNAIAEEDLQMGQQAQMMEFMLRNTLKGKSEDEVREVIKGIWSKLGDVLYPPDPEDIIKDESQLTLDDVEPTDYPIVDHPEVEHIESD